MEDRRFYIYVIFRPNGVPCYVGKGSGSRVDYHERNKHHYNKHLRGIIAAAPNGLPKVIVRSKMTEDEAFAAEVAWISAIGREAHGGPLVNLTDGGEGSSGYKLSGEALAKHRRRVANPAGADKLRRYHAEMTPDQKAARAAIISQRTKAAMASNGSSEKISLALAGRTHNAARRKLTSDTVKAAYRDNPDFREQQAARRKAEGSAGKKPMLGKKHSEETKARMRKSQSVRFAREKGVFDG